MTTLLDIAKANGSDAVVGLIDETQKAHPEITQIAARTIKGISYKTWVRTGLPTAQFRGGNEGVTPTSGQYEPRTVDTFVLNPRYEADVAIADAYEDGSAAYLAYEAEGLMEAAMRTLSAQFYYGTGNDSKGHPGLIGSYDRTKYEYDAGGTTDSTATSVWLIKTGEKFVQWVYGQNGQLQMSDVMRQRVTDTNNKPYTAYIQELLARPGLKVGSLRGLLRIKKLTDDAGKGLTDAVLAKAFAKLEASIRPDLILMNRRARSQLQQSRTVTLFGNATNKVTGGNAAVAPTPTAYDEVPIFVTDGITNTETLAL